MLPCLGTKVVGHSTALPHISREYGPISVLEAQFFLGMDASESE